MVGRARRGEGARSHGCSPVMRRRRSTRRSPTGSKRIRSPEATVAQVADHVEHVAKVAGYDHVGIGGDLDGIPDTPIGLTGVQDYPNLFAELIRRGWSDANLAKLAGGNILRVLRQAEAVSKSMADEPPAADPLTPDYQ